MNSNRYKLLGYLVWNGGRWYVRRTYLRRLPSLRKVLAASGGALVVTGAAVVLARRAQA